MNSALEIPLDTIGAAQLAVKWADRLELCDDLQTEGWTPNAALVRAARGLIDERGRAGARVVAMIRPRGMGAVEAPVLESFVATPAIIAASLREIDGVHEAGAHDVALGLVTAAGAIDLAAMATLIEHARARSLGVAFLRVIDLVADRERGMRDLVDLGIDRVLTAGVRGWDATVGSVEERVASLQRDRELMARHAQASGAALPAIVLGGGVRSGNARAFLRVSGELHSSCRAGGVFDAAEASAIRAAIDRVGGAPA